MYFFALEIETANEDRASICQIGIAQFENGKLIAEFESLIDPEDYFDPEFTRIHGIKKKHVKRAPIFPDLHKTLLEQDIIGRDDIVLQHTTFDESALNQACEKYGLPPLNFTWLDNARVVRRTWKQFAQKGYGLGNITQHLGITFSHHNALQDAIATGEVFLKACEVLELAPEDWVNRARQPIHGYQEKIKKIEGNPEGKYFGQKIVFTGALSMTRSEAAEKAAKLGCTVQPGVGKKTTLLVVGTQNIAEGKKSTKQLKAETLISEGRPIEIITEEEFLGLIT